MKVLVTGAAGFIGGQLCHALWKRGDTVVGIDNFSYGNPDNLRFEDHDFGPEVLRGTPCPPFLKRKASTWCTTSPASPRCPTARATRWRR